MKTGERLAFIYGEGLCAKQKLRIMDCGLAKWRHHDILIQWDGIFLHRQFASPSLKKKTVRDSSNAN